jgi:uncharacterized membrane-anchored protein YitT (DUF2179 family)
MKKHPIIKEIINYIIITAASLIYALGLYSFTVPSQIAPGGISGLFTAVNYLTGFPIGLGTILVNVPLLATGFFIIGKGFIVKSIYATILSSVALDYIYPLLAVPEYHGDRMLASLFGGVLIGAGIGILYARGGSSGGTDIICRLIKRRFPFIRIGMISLGIDFLIVVFSTFVFKEIESALYAVVSMYVMSVMIDRFVNGVSEGSFVFVITKKQKEVAKRILTDCDRGCTILSAEGGYSSEDVGVIVCALRNNERYKLEDVTKEEDPNAFIVVTSASEVLGNGFERGLR